MSEYLQQLGERLRLARVRRGFTQDQVAKQCSLSSRFVAKVEVGGGNISVAKLRELARALDIPIETLAAENLPASPAFEQSTTFLKKLAPTDLDNAHKRFVLATGGGIVSDPGNYNRLLSTCFTIWLRAKPEDHMARVLKQGDRRPMAQSRQAMRDLRRILYSREALYRQADVTVDTSGHSIKNCVNSLTRLAQQLQSHR